MNLPLSLGLLITLICAVLPLGFDSSVYAQETPSVVEEGPTDQVPVSVTDSNVEEDQSEQALSSVLESIKIIEGELSELRPKLEDATELERTEIEFAIQALIERRDSLKTDFESIATGVDAIEYEGSLDEKFLLKNELDALLEPIIGELKELTEKPREIEELRGELTEWERRLKTTHDALTNLESLESSELAPEIRESLESTRKTWAERKDSAENRIQAISYQLEQARNNQPSILETVRKGLRSFYRSRGRNFLLCLTAFFVTFFGLRFLHQQLDRFFPWKRKQSRPFYLRLVDVGLNLFSVIGAIVASILTLYATGDWVLMGLAIIILFGLVIAAKNALPKFYEQARMLLNLGEIREGERVVYGGIPWKVERLSFYTILRNEDLRGGEIRLPVNQLVGLISRPIAAEGEIWFPCHEGDWITLSEEGMGKVIAQSPEFVQIVKLGGAKVTMPTIEFLSKSPMTLSHGFRVSTTFGVDYSHQEISTTKIPEAMWAHLAKGLCQLVGERKNLVDLKVELSSAGASSLDYAIIADFDACMAPKYQVIARALQKLAVECCNENGWIIPFAQLTLHNAYESSTPPIPEEPVVSPKLP